MKELIECELHYLQSTFKLGNMRDGDTAYYPIRWVLQNPDNDWHYYKYSQIDIYEDGSYKITNNLTLKDMWIDYVREKDVYGHETGDEIAIVITIEDSSGKTWKVVFRDGKWGEVKVYANGIEFIGKNKNGQRFQRTLYREDGW